MRQRLPGTLSRVSASVFKGVVMGSPAGIGWYGEVGLRGDALRSGGLGAQPSLDVLPQHGERLCRWYLDHIGLTGR